MNKKLSLLILGTYVATSIVPTTVLAQEVISQENVTSINSTTQEKTEVNSSSTKATIKHIDENGNKIADEEVIVLDEGFKEYESYPKEINKFAVAVKINGQKVPYATSVRYALGRGLVDLSDIEIEWIYSDSKPNMIDTIYKAVYHKSFFQEPEEEDSAGELDFIFNEKDSRNIVLSWDMIDYLNECVDITTNLVTVTAHDGDKSVLEKDWIKNTPNFDYVDFFKVSIDLENPEPKGIEVWQNVHSESEKPEFDKMYVYTIDEINKKFVKVSTLEYKGSYESHRGGYDLMYDGYIENGFNKTYLYSFQELSKDEYVDENTKDEGIDGAPQLKDDNDNYRVAYKDLKEITMNIGDLNLFKGQDFVPKFNLRFQNLRNILKTKDESFVLSIDINGNSFNESPSILTGLSKDFYNKYSKQIYRWVHYKSNLDGNSFEKNNLISFPIDEKVKAGDTVYLYSVSNLKDGKVTLVGEEELTKYHFYESEDFQYGFVHFETKLDIADRAFFLTTSKIEVSDKIEENAKPEENDKTDGVDNAPKLTDDNGNYRVTYKYLKENIGVDDLCLFKGQDFVPDFLIKYNNIQNILKTKDESFVLSVDINGNSLNESPSILTGLSKDFHNRYGKQIYRWVHYKSNLGEKSFENNNVMSFPIDEKIKEGDTLYLYSTSNLKDGKVTLVGEKKIDKSDFFEDSQYGEVSFNTKLDIADRAFFLTTSKVEVTDKGSLPSTGGINQVVFISSGLAIVAASGFIILGKRKKKNNE